MKEGFFLKWREKWREICFLNRCSYSVYTSFHAIIKTSKGGKMDNRSRGRRITWSSSTFPKSELPALHIYRGSRGGWKTEENAVEGCPVK